MVKLDKVLRMPAVCEATGYGITQLKEKMDKDPDFPKPFRLSKNGRAIGIWESELITYQAKRRAERDEQAKQPPRPRPVIAPNIKTKAKVR